MSDNGDDPLPPADPDAAVPVTNPGDPAPPQTIALDPAYIGQSLQALVAANAQLRDRLRLAIELNQEMANTLGVIVETHGIDDPTRGGKTLSVHKSMIPQVDQSFLETAHDEDGRVYFTLVKDPEELKRVGLIDSHNKAGRVVKMQQAKRRGDGGGH